MIEIWRSLRRLPLWVQLWMMLWLVPVNMVSLFFLESSYGIWIAIAAIGGMALNLPVMVMAKGFSRLMALPHLLLWTPQVFLIAWILVQAERIALYESYLLILMITNIISLMFDFPDFYKWLKGARQTF